MPASLTEGPLRTARKRNHGSFALRGAARAFQATGGNFAKLFDVQNKKFITVSCRECGYTELYRAETGAGMNILDFLIGN